MIKITQDYGKKVNIYIVYEVSKIYDAKTIYLVQLHELKMLILISINILDVVLDLIEKDFFHNLVVELVEM